MFFNPWNSSAGVGGSGAGAGAPGLIDEGDEITVANYAALPAAADNSGKLAWVLSTTGSLWTKKYSGWYVSDGATWAPADIQDDQDIRTDTIQLGHDSDTTLARASAGVVSVEGVNVLLASAIGSTVQAYDAELAALAGLTSAADKLPYFTGSGTASVTAFTAAARALLDDADANAMLTTLGGAAYTGSGGVVRATSPVLVGPTLGSASATQLALANGGSIDSDTSGTMLWRIWDSDDGTYRTFITGTVGNTPDMTIAAPTGGTLAIKASNTGLSAYDTDASHILTIKPGSNLTAARILTLTTGDSARTLDISAADVTISTFGASLIDDAASSNARTTLGLAIGTDVQAYDAELAALAGLTSAADKGIYFTGVGTAGTYDLSTFARTVLDDTTAGAAATTLGLGTGNSPQFTGIELGHASDTTMTRSAAGRVAVEGSNLMRVSEGIIIRGCGSSSAPSTGQQGSYTVCPVAGTITAWGFIVDAGTATMKVWKRATGTTAPTSADNINTSGVAISANSAVRSTTVSDFTNTAVAAGDFLAFNLTAVSGVAKYTFWIEITPT